MMLTRPAAILWNKRLLLQKPKTGFAKKGMGVFRTVLAERSSRSADLNHKLKSKFCDLREHQAGQE